MVVDGLSDLDELNVAGIATFLGGVNIGDDVNSDVLTLNAKIGSHLIPNANNKDIGSSTSPWRNMYVNNISGTLTGSASQLNVVEDESFNVDETRLAVTINATTQVISGISTDGIEVDHEVEELDDNQGNNIIPAGTTVDAIGNSQITLNQQTANTSQTIGTLRFGYFGDTNAVRNIIFSSVATNGTTVPLIDPHITFNPYNNNMGLGTNSPAYSLDFGEDSASTIRLVSTHNSTAIRIGAGDIENKVTLIRVDGQASNKHGESDSGAFGFSLDYRGDRSNRTLSFVTDNRTGEVIEQDENGDDVIVTTGPIEALTILEDANVGIGSTNPTQKLDVGGNLKVLGNIDVAGNGSAATITAPASLTIDPAVVGDNTGTVYIKGDLQVEGTQTIINSTTLTVNDKLITLSDESTSAANSDESGIEVALGGSTYATIKYRSGTDERWDFNKKIKSSNGAQLGYIKIGVTANGEIDTISGDLTLDSQSGKTIIDDNLEVTGTITGTASTATNIANGSAGQIPYQTDVSTTSFISTTTTAGQVLHYNTTTNTPYWATVSVTSVGSATNANKIKISDPPASNDDNREYPLIFTDVDANGQHEDVFSNKTLVYNDNTSSLTIKNGGDIQETTSFGIHNESIFSAGNATFNATTTIVPAAGTTNINRIDLVATNSPTLPYFILYGDTSNSTVTTLVASINDGDIVEEFRYNGNEIISPGTKVDSVTQVSGGWHVTLDKPVYSSFNAANNTYVDTTDGDKPDSLRFGTVNYSNKFIVGEPRYTDGISNGLIQINNPDDSKVSIGCSPFHDHKLKVTGSSYFEGDVEITGTLTATIASDTINLGTSNTNSDFKIPFANHTGNTAGDYALLQDSGSGQFTYNPSTNTLTVGTVDGTVSNATNATYATYADRADVKTIGSSSINNEDHQITFSLGTNTSSLPEYLYNAEDFHYNPYTDRLGIKVGRRHTVHYDNYSTSNVFRTSGRLHINQIEISNSITKNDVDVTSGTNVINLSGHGGSTGITLGMYVRPVFYSNQIVIPDDTKVIGVNIDGTDTVRLSRNVSYTRSTVDLIFGTPDYDEAFLVTDSGNVAISTSPFGNSGDGSEPYKLGVGGDVRINGNLDITGTINTSISGNSGSTDEIKTVEKANDTSTYLTFVADHNTSATAESLHTNSGLLFDSQNQKLGISTDLTPSYVNARNLGLHAKDFEFTAGTVDLDSFDVTNDSYNFKVVEYMVWFNSGSKIQAGKVLIMQNGGTPYIQEFAIMYEPSRIANLTAVKVGDEVKLRATMESGISGTIKCKWSRSSLL